MQADYLRYATPDRDDGVDTVQANLAETDERLSHLCTERAFHLAELTQELSLSPTLDEQTLWAITERLFMPSREHDAYKSATVFADIVTLCNEIADALPDGYYRVFADLFGEDTPLADSAVGRVAYVANSFTEQAFSQLCGDTKGCRVSYHHHFDDVCQEVYNGHSQYGILPVQSSAEGMLAGLYRMVARYRLKICAVCRVAGANDSHTVFALVKRTLDVNQKPLSSCFDFLYTPANARDVSDLLCVAGLFGHHLLCSGSYTGTDGETFRLSLSIHADTFYPFLVYLSLFCADLVPIGIYQVK